MRKIEKAFVIFKAPRGSTYAEAQEAAEAVKAGQLVHVTALSGRDMKVCPAIGKEFTPFSKWDLPASMNSVGVGFTNPSEVKGVVTFGRAEEVEGEEEARDVWYVTVGGDIEFPVPEN